jgi:hypothetical protein
MIRGIDKDVRKLLIFAERQGCVVEHTQKNHIRVSRSGRCVCLPGRGHNPSYAAKLARSRLGKLGVHV